jgi:hypothetical protein
LRFALPGAQRTRSPNGALVAYACWTYNGNLPGGGPAFACDYTVLCCICLEVAGEDQTKDIMPYDRLTILLSSGPRSGTRPATVAAGLWLPSLRA